MGKHSHNQKKYPNRKFLKEYTIGDYTFTVGMKIVWNWSSPLDQRDCDSENRVYLKIASIFEENNEIYFIPISTSWRYQNGPFRFAGMTKTSSEDTFANRMNLRPWNINPRIFIPN